MPSISSEPPSRSIMSGSSFSVSGRSPAMASRTSVGLQAAIFIDDHRQTDWRLLELIEHPEDRRRHMNDQMLPDHGHGIKGLSVEDLVEKILLQDHADRLVDIAAADQELLMGAFVNGARDLLARS